MAYSCGAEPKPTQITRFVKEQPCMESVPADLLD